MTTSQVRWRLPFAVLLFSSVFCADTPQTHPFAVATMGAAFAWLIVQFLFDRTVPLNLVSAGFGSLLLVLLISLPVALGKGTTFFDWALRGFAPLAFLFVFFFLRIRNHSDVNFVIGMILVASALWCVLTFFDLVQNYQRLASTRWTLLSSQLLLPFNLVGIALIVLGTRVITDRFAIPLLFFLIVLTLGGGYRSHLLLVLAIFTGAIALAAFGYGNANRLKIASVILVALLPLPFFFSSSVGPSAEWIRQSSPSQMLSTALNNRGDVGRKLEFRYAVTQFLDAPVFGKGLAYRIPSELIFDGQALALAKIEQDHGKKYPFVFYTHNSLGYLLMTTGLAGLGAVAAILGGLFRAMFRTTATAPRNQRIVAGVAIMTLGAFSLVSAAYLLPQFNIMIGALCAIVAADEGT